VAHHRKQNLDIELQPRKPKDKNNCCLVRIESVAMSVYYYYYYYFFLFSFHRFFHQ
jgi:hypothetical protein